MSDLNRFMLDNKLIDGIWCNQLDRPLCPADMARAGMMPSDKQVIAYGKYCDGIKFLIREDMIHRLHG